MGIEVNQRKQERLRAVLPVRVWGTDANGANFEELAHTLDVAPQGGRLGAIHYQLKVADTLTVQYRQHKMEFRVVWTKLLEKAKEYQVGLQAVSQDKEAWGLTRSDFRHSTLQMQGKVAPARGAA